MSILLTGLYSPSTLILILWFCFIGAHEILRFYSINLITQLHVACYLSSYVMGSIIMQKTKVTKSKYYWDAKILNKITLVLILCLLVFLPIIYFDLKNNGLFDANNKSQAIRRYYDNLNIIGKLPISLKIVSNFSIILLVLTFMKRESNNITKPLVLILGLIGISASFSKGYFVLLLSFLMAIVIFYKRNKYLYIIGIVIFALSILVYSSIVRDRIDISKYFKIYFLSSLPAYQMIVNNEFKFAFPTALGFIIRPIMYFLDMPIDKPINGNFVNVPESTNVFTAFGPIYSNFGFLISVVYFFINGIIAGKVYKLGKMGHIVFKIFYGYIIFSIITSIFSDGFANISTIFNYLLIFMMIHMFTKKKISANCPLNKKDIN